MPEPALLSVDIGSTFTKGALFVPEGDALSVRTRASVPTTVDDLSRGFEAVEAVLRRAAGPGGIGRAYLSSSARGGLKIAAVGLTADLTVSIARQAACSAGGKVVKAYAYRLTRAEVAELEALAPDIVLFTGGTDGGHEKTNLLNAEALAASALASIILYAGNAKVRDEVMDRLRGKDAVAADNVMPEVGEVRIEPAREVIRRVFLERIVDGKGLSQVVRRIGTEPKPTPLAVFDLVRTIPDVLPDWSDLGVIDMGGATTDFYSNSDPVHDGAGVLVKGLPEPRVKRTVEGDLGLRVSVLALTASEAAYLEARLAAEGLDKAGFEAYVAAVAARPEAVPVLAASKSATTPSWPAPASGPRPCATPAARPGSPPRRGCSTSAAARILAGFDAWSARAAFFRRCRERRGAGRGLHSARRGPREQASSARRARATGRRRLSLPPAGESRRRSSRRGRPDGRAPSHNTGTLRGHDHEKFRPALERLPGRARGGPARLADRPRDHP